MLRGTWTCPYCGFVNVRQIEDGAVSPAAVYCDSEDGGCDRLVVLEVRSIEVTFEIRRIEGYGNWHVVGGVSPAAEITHAEAESRLRMALLTFGREVTELERGVPFSTLDKVMRLRMVALFGEALAEYVGGNPTMSDWDSNKPAWMPQASSIAQSYDIGAMGWKGMAREWHENKVPQ